MSRKLFLEKYTIIRENTNLTLEQTLQIAKLKSNIETKKSRKGRIIPILVLDRFAGTVLHKFSTLADCAEFFFKDRKNKGQVRWALENNKPFLDKYILTKQNDNITSEQIKQIADLDIKNFYGKSPKSQNTPILVLEQGIVVHQFASVRDCFAQLRCAEDFSLMILKKEVRFVGLSKQENFS